MKRQERSELMERRADMANAVLNVLMMAMESDCPPLDGVVNKTIWAVTELLSVPETVA